jgi:hypothetical protein
MLQVYRPNSPVLEAQPTISWRIISPSTSLPVVVPPPHADTLPLLSRFFGQYGEAGPRRVLPSSVEDLPEFASIFPETFFSHHKDKSKVERVVVLMAMMTKLSRFTAATSHSSVASSAASSVGGCAAVDTIDQTAVSTEHYLGSAAHGQALEEVVKWLATAAAKQVTFAFEILLHLHE